MTIHRARLGPELLQGARDERPLTLLSVVAALMYWLLLLSLLTAAVWDLALALHTRTAASWDGFWEAARDMPQMMSLGILVPLVIPYLYGMRLQERTARRYALLGDEHWAPALDAQPALLTPAEQAQDVLDFGTIYAPRANRAILSMGCGVLLVAMGGGLAWLLVWAASQALPVPAGSLFVALGIVAMMSAIVGGCVAVGIWLIWRGARLNGGVHLTGDDAALLICSRRGRERARIAWHEIRAMSAQIPAAGSDRSTYYLDTGDHVLIWVESSFEPSTVRAQHALLRRAVVTRADVPLRNVTPVYTRIPAVLRDLTPQRRNARTHSAGTARVQLDDAEPTETDRAIWQPLRALHRLQRRLAIVGGILLAAAILLDATAFMLQHVLGMGR